LHWAIHETLRSKVRTFDARSSNSILKFFLWRILWPIFGLAGWNRNAEVGIATERRECEQEEEGIAQQGNVGEASEMAFWVPRFQGHAIGRYSSCALRCINLFLSKSIEKLNYGIFFFVFVVIGALENCWWLMISIQLVFFALGKEKWLFDSQVVFGFSKKSELIQQTTSLYKNGSI